MMEITKDYLEELIQEKAERRVDKLLLDILRSWRNTDLDGNGNVPIKFNDKCGELSGKSLYSTYGNGGSSLLNANGFKGNGECDTAMLEECTNWNEIKSKLLDEYKKAETDMILKKLSGIGEFLDRYGE